MGPILEYEKLVKDYYENLHTTLRNFRPEPEYLESWVHDEDHSRSILGIFEAAESGNLSELNVRVRPEVAASLNRAWMTENLALYGVVSFNETKEGFLVTLKYQTKKAPAEVHPAYAKRLETIAKKLSHDGKIPASSKGQVAVSATYEGITLSLLCDKAGIVLAAKHSGAKGMKAPLIDRLCGILEMRPLQEGAEHAVIRLEIELRDPAGPRPVAGLITPQNADPIFKVATELSRQIFATYLAQTGTQPVWNDWEDPASPKWMALTPEQKMAKVHEGIVALCKEHKLPFDHLDVLMVRNHTRVVLSYDKKFNHPQFGQHLMLIERELHKRLEGRLEIVLESVEDKNKREERSKRDAAFGENDRKEVPAN